MENKYIKENTNVYFLARKKAAVCNERLKSRESTAELLGLHPSTLAGYELGKAVPEDMVVLMADLYNAPELMTRYCVEECPIHGFLPLATKEEDMQGTTLKLLKDTEHSRLEKMRIDLIDMMSDGQISDAEKISLERIVKDLEMITKDTSALKISCEKHFHKRR